MALAKFASANSWLDDDWPAMTDFDKSLSELGRLLEQRIAVVGTLAHSLEASRLALGQNNAEAIARGAAHQAELCRQWSRLEDQLRAESVRRYALPSAPISAASLEARQSARIEAEWATLAARIRYLSACTGHCCGTCSAVWEF